MVRWLLVISVVVLVVLLIKASWRREVAKQPGGEPKGEDMVRCQVCGVNLPRSEAIISGGRYYCGEEHRRLDGAG